MNATRAREGWISFPEKLRTSDRCVLGTWVKIPALETVELLAVAGFDFIVIDHEHAPMTLESAYRATVVAQSLGMHVLVRTPDRSGNYTQRLLDMGVDGLLIPQVSCGAEARRVVSEMVHAPRGHRGMGITSRAGMWGGLSHAEYIRRGTEETMRGVQIESLDALGDIEAILDTPDLNAAFLGSGDLSMSTGLSRADPAFQAYIDTFLAATSKRGVPAGTAVGNGAAAVAAAEQGFIFVMVSNDAQMFGQVARSVLAASRNSG